MDLNELDKEEINDNEDDKELLYLNRAPRCGFCQDKGIIFAYSTKRPNDGMYAFKCDCNNGPPWLLDRKFPYWGSKPGFVNSRLELPPHPVSIWDELDKSEGKSDLFKLWVDQWGRNRFVAHYKLWKAKKTNGIQKEPELGKA